MSAYSTTITGTSGLTNYWRFEGNGTATTGAANMTIASGYSTTSGGKDELGLTSDATTKTGNTASIANTFFNAAYSIEVWFKVTNNRPNVQSLVRMSNDLALEIDSAGKVHYYYMGFDITSASAYDDSKWHHLVITRNSSRLVTMYVDGSSTGTPVTVGTSAPASSSLYFLGDQYTAHTVPNGQMDEAALYNTNLSGATVTAHYDAGKGTTAVADLMTATANMRWNTNTGMNQAFRRLDAPNNITDRVTRLQSNNALSTNDELRISSSSGVYYSLVSVPLSQITNGWSKAANVKLWLRRLGGTISGDGIVNVYKNPSINKPSGTPVSNFSANVSNGTWVSADVTSIVNDAITAGDNTVYIALMGGSGFGSGNPTFEAGTSVTTQGQDPYLEMTYVQAVLVNATPLTASGTAVDPVVSTTKAVNYSATPMVATADMLEPSVGTAAIVNPYPATASGVMVDPAVSTTKSPTLAAAAMTASATMPGGNYSAPAGGVSTAMTASATMANASVSLTQGVLFNADALTATARLVVPNSVNGNPIAENQDEDDYYVRVRNLQPLHWWRLNDTGSYLEDINFLFGIDSPEFDRDGTAVNTLPNRNGPQGRAAMYFNGTSYLRQNSPAESLTIPRGSESGLINTSIEFSLRTDKANQFIMQSDDDYYTFENTGTTSNPPPYSIHLVDGKISLQNWVYSTGVPIKFNGFKSVNDGEWHHIVIKRVPGQFGQLFGVEIWIDGKFDRRTTRVSNFIGFPDYVGALPGMEPSQAFVGDLTEIAFYTGAMSDTDIARNYYAFMGWKPIAASPATATAVMPNARGKGNQKRALTLYWNRNNRATLINGPLSGGTINDPKPYATTMDAYGFKMFVKSIQLNDQGLTRFDDVYDFPTLIDLERDVDLEDYDAIVIADWPEASADFDYIKSAFRPGAYDELVQQLKDAAIAGKSIFVPSPRLAIDLGIVDRIDDVPLMFEQKFSPNQGNALNLYDYGSAAKFPWNIASSDGITGGGTRGGEGTGLPMNNDPAFLAGKAFYYADTNYINKFRVRANVDGLTSLPSYMIQDSVFHVDYDPFGNQGAAYKYLHRENGLLIGDEFEYQGTGAHRFADLFSAGYRRPFGDKVLAVPPGHVKTGLILTTFSATFWNDKSIVTNPYAEHATTIVVRPGDQLDGQSIQGKVFVSFTEDANGFAHGVAAPVHRLPAPDNDVTWPATYVPDTAAQREWEYSFTRSTEISTNVNTTTVVYITDVQGNVVPVVTPGTDLPYSRTYDLFPVDVYPVLSITTRGLLWLGQVQETAPGDVRIAATPLTASAEMKQPAVTGQKPAQVNATAMVANAFMPKVAEDQSGDAQVIVLPMTATATMTGYSKIIYAEPMTATATIVEPAEVNAGGDHIVLTLHNRDATLFIKEKV